MHVANRANTLKITNLQKARDETEEVWEGGIGKKWALS